MSRRRVTRKPGEAIAELYSMMERRRSDWVRLASEVNQLRREVVRLSGGVTPGSGGGGWTAELIGSRDYTSGVWVEGTATAVTTPAEFALERDLSLLPRLTGNSAGAPMNITDGHFPNLNTLRTAFSDGTIKGTFWSVETQWVRVLTSGAVNTLAYPDDHFVINRSSIIPIMGNSYSEGNDQFVQTFHMAFRGAGNGLGGLENVEIAVRVSPSGVYVGCNQEDLSHFHFTHALRNGDWDYGVSKVEWWCLV